jgi:tetratricopeptide (TPR) repeat protein
MNDTPKDQAFQDDLTLGKVIHISLQPGHPADTEATIADLMAEAERRVTENDPGSAEHILRQLVKAAPDSGDIKLSLAGLYCHCNYPDKALPLLEEVLIIDRHNVPARVRQAAIYYQRNQISRAIEISEALIDIEPGDPTHSNNLGVYQMAAGKFADAAKSYLAAIALDNTYIAPYHNLSSLPEIKFSDEQLAHLLQLSEQATLTTDDRAIVKFCISKHYRHQGSPEKEFRYLDAAKSILAEASPWNESMFSDIVEHITSLPTDIFQQYQRHAEQKLTLVFVASMPRAGSTLIEQMISAHPLASSLGEAGLATHALRATAHANPGTTPDYWEWPGRDNADKLFRGAFVEFDTIIGRLGTETDYVCEKSVNNDLLLGLCLMAYPNARFIHLRRHPLDVCLSAYQTYFAKGLEFANRLSWLATRYQMHQRLMAHWIKVFPNRFISIDYEDLIDDPRPCIAGILEFIGLPWADECLGDYSTGDSVRSASNWQVRQPLNKSSAGRWQQYRSQLNEILYLNSNRSVQ